jgi:hypothetical protein
MPDEDAMDASEPPRMPERISRMAELMQPSLWQSWQPNASAIVAIDGELSVPRTECPLPEIFEGHCSRGAFDRN